MIRAIDVAPASGGSVHATDDRVVLDFEARYRRRITMQGEAGTEFLLDLAKPTRLQDGDVLLLEDGRRIAVVAAPEPLAEIVCEDLRLLVRVAWHLGNRHLPTMLAGDRLFIRRDHVIEAMTQGLGAHVAHVMAPFVPEGGAYAGGHHHHGDDDVPPRRGDAHGQG
jgi:urease accessory protein